MKTRHALFASVLTSGLVASAAAHAVMGGAGLGADGRSVELSESPISRQVRQLVADALVIPLSEVTPLSSLASDLGADSIDCVELVMKVEQTFGIDISEDAAEKVIVVADLIRLAETLPRKM